jgi:transcriptional regulator with XRE-family HTH domain
MKNKNKNEQIKELRNKYKLTLKEIGSRFNLSSERIRQIVNDFSNSKEDLYQTVKKEYCNKIGGILKSSLLEEVERLSKPDRRKELVIQRTALVKILHDEYGFSFRQIGFLLERTHKSVINLYKK